LRARGNIGQPRGAFDFENFDETHARGIIEPGDNCGVSAWGKVFDQDSVAASGWQRGGSSGGDRGIVHASPIIVRVDRSARAVVEREHRIGENACHIVVRKRRPDRANEHLLRAAGANDEACDQDISTRADLCARGDIG